MKLFKFSESLRFIADFMAYACIISATILTKHYWFLGLAVIGVGAFTADTYFEIRKYFERKNALNEMSGIISLIECARRSGCTPELLFRTEFNSDEKTIN